MGEPENKFHIRADLSYATESLESNIEIFTDTTAYFITTQNIQFYSYVEFEHNRTIKIKLRLSTTEYFPLTGKIVAVIPPIPGDPRYKINLELLDMDTEKKHKINNFLTHINIEQVMSYMMLDDIVDIYFVSGSPPIVKKYGELLTYEMDIFDQYVLKTMLLSILDDERYDMLMKERELNFMWTDKNDRRFRVNLHFQRRKLEGTFRLIPNRISTPSELGLPKNIEVILETVKKGLIMIAGKTGSGKSTTIASMLDYINSRRSNIIICIEDPIEYLHENRNSVIKQREVGTDTLSFAKAAKNALRQNPDVLVVGEILDMETMDTAITAAETGALVFTTIHAGTVTLALDRVATFFSAELQQHILKRLSLVLKGIIVQELIPRSDGKGLILASELLVTNNAVKRSIRDADWNQIKSILQLGKKEGMQSMQDSLQALYKAEKITYEYVDLEK